MTISHEALHELLTPGQLEHSRQFYQHARRYGLTNLRNRFAHKWTETYGSLFDGPSERVEHTDGGHHYFSGGHAGKLYGKATLEDVVAALLEHFKPPVKQKGS